MPSWPGPAWFETHGVAALLTMRVQDLMQVSDLILRSAQSARLEG